MSSTQLIVRFYPGALRQGQRLQADEPRRRPQLLLSAQASLAPTSLVQVSFSLAFSGAIATFGGDGFLHNRGRRFSSAQSARDLQLASSCLVVIRRARSCSEFGRSTARQQGQSARPLFKSRLPLGVGARGRSSQVCAGASARLLSPGPSPDERPPSASVATPLTPELLLSFKLRTARNSHSATDRFSSSRRPLSFHPPWCRRPNPAAPWTSKALRRSWHPSSLRATSTTATKAADGCTPRPSRPIPRSLSSTTPSSSTASQVRRCASFCSCFLPLTDLEPGLPAVGRWVTELDKRGDTLAHTLANDVVVSTKHAK